MHGLGLSLNIMDAACRPTGDPKNTNRALTGFIRLTGQGAQVIYGRLPQVNAQGSFALAGQAAGMVRSFVSTNDQGSVVLAGQAANVGMSKVQANDVGLIGLTGQDATLSRTYIQVSDQATFGLSTFAAALVYSGSSPGAYNLLATMGTITLSGQAANPTWGHNPSVNAQGTFTLTGQAAGMLRSYLQPNAQGTFTLTGDTMTPIVNYITPADQGSIALAGQAANMLRGYVQPNAQGTFALAGQAANIVYSNAGAPYTLVAAQGSIVLSGKAATLTYSGASGTAPTIDGHAIGIAGDFGGSNTTTIALTTTKTQDLIVVAISCEDTATPHATISSVTATGLTFTKRSSVYQDNITGLYGATWNTLEIWSAPAAAVQTAKVITVTASKSIDCGVVAAFGVNYDTATPPVWTANAPLTTTSGTTAAPSLGGGAASKANLMFGFAISALDSNQTAGASYTLLDTNNNPNGGVAMALGIEYKSNGAAVSSQTVPFGSSWQTWSMIVDAIEAP